MMLWLASPAGWSQVSWRLLELRAVTFRPAGASGRSGPGLMARRALAWLVPALFSAMHW